RALFAEIRSGQRKTGAQQRILDLDSCIDGSCAASSCGLVRSTGKEESMSCNVQDAGSIYLFERRLGCVRAGEDVLVRKQGLDGLSLLRRAGQRSKVNIGEI